MTARTAPATFNLDAKRRWAKAQLEVAGDEDTTAVGAMLKHLSDENFAPSPAAREAIRTLSAEGDAAATDPLGDYSVALEMRLNEEIEAFAGEFFSLFVGDRIRRLEELQVREGLSAPQCARLAELSKAAYVNPPPADSDDPRMADLAARIGELFVLPPAARAPRVREELSQMNQAGADWSAAAAKLQRSAPAIANLLPRFVREIVELHPARQIEISEQRQRLHEAAVREPLPAWTDDFGKSEGSRGWIFVVCLTVFFGIRVLSALQSEADRTSNYRDGQFDYSQTRPIDYPPVSTPDIERDFRYGGNGRNDSDWQRYLKNVRQGRVQQGSKTTNGRRNSDPRIPGSSDNAKPDPR